MSDNPLNTWFVVRRWGILFFTYPVHLLGILLMLTTMASTVLVAVAFAAAGLLPRYGDYIFIFFALICILHSWIAWKHIEFR